MSLKRYYISGLRPHIWEHPEGEMVYFEDYVTLQAENARLKAEVERLTKAHSDALADFWAIHKGYFDLKAEAERLRKAGDAVCESPYALETDPAVIEWRAAKEGNLNV